MDKRIVDFEAQVTDFLLEKDIRLEIGETRKSIDTPLRKLLRIFSGIEDPRVKGRTVYPIGCVVLLAFLAYLGGADSFIAIADFWGVPDMMRIYKRIFRMDALPSHDTIRRTIGLIDDKDFNDTVISVVIGALRNMRRVMKIEEPKTKLVSVDGKELRGTGVNPGTPEEIRNLQTLNVYDAYSGTFLFSEAIEKKTNEIPHAQKILKAMNLKGVIVTFDAMNTQKDTVKVIIDGKGDYCGGLKGNHSGIYEYALEYFDGKTLGRISKDPRRYCRTSEISHNQLEEREFFVHALTKKEKDGEFKDWAGARSIVCYRKHMIHNVTGKETSESRTYITSLSDADLISYSIRAHWGVESNHWYLDTVMKEDELRTTDRNAALNISIMNKAILSLYKRFGELLNAKEKVSKKRIRLMFSWDYKGMLAKLLALFDEKTLRDALVITPRKPK